jgi:hypothetical protein
LALCGGVAHFAFASRYFPEQLADGRERAAEPLAIARRLGDCASPRRSDRDRAGVARQRYGRDAIRYGEASGRDDLLAFAHINQAVYAAAAGDAVTARRSATAGLQIAVQRRFAEYLSWSIQALAAVSIADGDFTRAARAIGFRDARAGIVHAPRKAHSRRNAHNGSLGREQGIAFEEPVPCDDNAPAARSKGAKPCRGSRRSKRRASTTIWRR